MHVHFIYFSQIALTRSSCVLCFPNILLLHFVTSWSKVEERKSSVGLRAGNPINPGKKSESAGGTYRYSGIINGMQTT